MNFKSKNTIKWLGPNLEKGKRNYENEEKRAKDEFKKKYPYADISKFDFWVNINQKGEISSPTEIVYTSGKDTRLYNETGTLWKYSWNTNSQTFKNMYQSNLYWGSENGIFQPTEKLISFRAEGAKLGFDLTKFPIYVTESKSFTSNFENLETKWDESANDASLRRTLTTLGTNILHPFAPLTLYFQPQEFVKNISKPTKTFLQLLRALCVILFTIT